MTQPETATASLKRFDHAWSELDRAIRTLGEPALTDVRDPVGWAAKDHLMHVAAWEQSLLAKLDGRPRHEALGIDEATLRDGDDDTINAAIFEATRHRPLRDVLEKLRSTHAATRTRLAALVDGTVDGTADGTARPSAGAAAGADAAATLLSEVPGYAEHYEQHLGWLRELVGGAAV